MENCLVTYGFNEDTERIEHLRWICDQLCTVFSKNIIGNVCSHDSEVFLFLVVFYLHFFVLFVISFPVLSLVFRSFFVSN